LLLRETGPHKRGKRKKAGVIIMFQELSLLQKCGPAPFVLSVKNSFL
jgi:hypothetical protein